jgi:hypothetical protein
MIGSCSVETITTFNCPPRLSSDVYARRTRQSDDTRQRGLKQLDDRIADTLVSTTSNASVTSDVLVQFRPTDTKV